MTIRATQKNRMSWPAWCERKDTKDKLAKTTQTESTNAPTHERADAKGERRQRERERERGRTAEFIETLRSKLYAFVTEGVESLLGKLCRFEDITAKGTCI